MSELFPVDMGGKGELAKVIRCRNIAEILVRKYPGYMWAVQPYKDGSAYQIRCMNLSGTYGLIIHETKIDNDYKIVVTLAGELLERYRQSRVKMDGDAVKDIPKLFTGERVFDV